MLDEIINIKIIEIRMFQIEVFMHIVRQGEYSTKRKCDVNDRITKKPL